MVVEGGGGEEMEEAMDKVGLWVSGGGSGGGESIRKKKTK